MDQFLVDAGDAPVAAGDEIVLLGAQGGTRGGPAGDGTGGAPDGGTAGGSGTGGDASVTADDWAAWLGTINYEVVTGVGRRVPRVHVGAAGRVDPGDGTETGP